MLIVAGLSLKNLKPQVWDPKSPYYLEELKAIMVSYADFKEMPTKRRAAMQMGLREFLGVPRETSIYLDNGAFHFAANGTEPTTREYREFIRETKPDWHPIRFDAIPAPNMSWQTQAACYRRTMRMNYAYQQDGYVPVVHAGRYLGKYIDEIEAHPKLSTKDCIALGALVPLLLRTPKAAAYSNILDDLVTVRARFPGKRVHVFGIGGTATLHLAALLGFDSVDSSGWRNRAARGIIQMPGSGERMVAELGNWRGRRPNKQEWKRLRKCQCPGCQKFGAEHLRRSGLDGFCHRAAHNLWILVREGQWLKERLANGTYERCYRQRLDNTVYLPLVAKVLESSALQKKASQ